MTPRAGEEVCPYCGGATRLVDSAVIYGRSYGQAWVCERYPECDAYVGCHKGTDKPLGRLANAALRQAKQQAHAAFDPLWQSGAMTRAAAYEWLAAQVGVDVEDCHIGFFDLAQCARVVMVCPDIEERGAP